MRKVIGNSPLLDELEEIVRPKPFTYRSIQPRSLTLKTSTDYLESKGFKGSRSVVNRLESIVPSAHEQLKKSKLNSVIARFCKRTIDLAGALIGVILTIPFWLVIPILIKLESRGPIFYTQLRVGRNRRENRRRHTPNENPGNSRQRERRRDNNYGETFSIIKFRTMVDEAEKDSGPVWAAVNDPRVTNIGKILRKSRLDEIPQFINVLIGDMSIVGPRPERPSFVKELSDKIDGYDRRHIAKPGITGLAQVNCSYDTSQATVARKLKFDLDYIDSWSLWLDFKILVKTIGVVLTGKGAQ